MYWRCSRFREVVIVAGCAMLACASVKAQNNFQQTRATNSPLHGISAQQPQQQRDSLDLAFKGNSFAQALSKNSHAFAASAPLDLASKLANANLPPTSGKIYSFPALAQFTFLGRSSQELLSLPNFAAPGLDISRLRRAKVPDLTKNK